MPAIPAVLTALVEAGVDANMAAVAGTHPLAQPNPAFFIEMCTAIATGIASGSPAIAFTTSDSGFGSAPPIPGAGTGVGIVVDANWMTEDMYTRIRAQAIADYGSTSHEVYPPSAKNSGQYLLALCKGIADSIKTHFATAFVLTSVHPLVYAGTGNIAEGNFSGLSDSLIKGLIVAAAPSLKGDFWPKLADCIAKSYVEGIQMHSTGMVTIVGICIPTPIPPLVCNLPMVGSGTGVAA